MTEDPHVTLKDIPLFRDLSDRQLKRLRDISVHKRFERGTIVFRDGEPAEGFHLVRTGQVKVYKLSPDGREQILKIFRPGETVGEVVMFAGDNYPAFCEALQDTETLLFLRNAFISILNSDPELATNLVAVLSRRLLHFTRMVGDLSLRDVPARLAAYIQDHMDAANVMTLDITKAQLATLLGTSPETISRVLGSLSDRGVLTVDRRRITVLEPERLAAVAGCELS